MNRILILSGPTGIGKTSISIKIAKKLNGEIISADSMQIYKYMDIGSAKIHKDEMENINHHVIDLIDPKESFTVSEFKKRAITSIEDIISRGKLPIIVGGTGLYIDSILYDYSFTDAIKDEEYRDELLELARIHGNEYVHEMLREKDVLSYESIHCNNLKRVIRALEVYKITGKPFSEYKIEGDKPKENYDFKYFVLTMNREILYENINKRVDLMIEKGLVEEVHTLKHMGLTKDMQSMKGIGYKEVLEYLQGEISLDEAIDRIKQSSRNYAKRQLTWFRKNPNIIWVNKDEFSNEYEIIDYIINNM